MTIEHSVRTPIATELEAGFTIRQPEAKQPTARIIVGGDICPIGRGEKLADTEYATDIWKGVADKLAVADLRIANLECPLTTRQSPILKSGPALSAKPTCAQGICAGKFEVLTLANNHIMDMGADGFNDTLKACHAAGIRTVGAGENLATAQEHLCIDVHGVRVACLAFTENEFSIATNNRAGACPLDIPENYFQIQRARANADFVLVVLHGGNENYPLPRPGLIKVCHFFAKTGAHAIVCHHTHIASGVEMVGDTPVIYGTGNLLFDWPDEKPDGWHTGFLVELQIQRGATLSFRLLPYHQFVEDSGITQMAPAGQVDFLRKIEKRSRVIADPYTSAREWRAFCQRTRPDYLSMLFSRYWGEGTLFKALPFLWKPWLTRKRMDTVLGLIRCESHREALIELLASKADKE